MADTKNTLRSESPVSPIRSTEGRPESPTTAQPLDFDDDQETAAHNPSKMSATESVSKPAPPSKDENPPAKPPRPLNPRDQAEQTLREAFPTIDFNIIRAVLTASGGQMEPAFNALLEMTDPEASQREPTPPARPPRPAKQPPTTTRQSQLEADEMYARQLAEHYNGPPEQQPRPNRYNENLQGSRVGRPGQNPNPDDYQWRSFIDDDLPEIRENIKKGFWDTQKTVNSWINNFKKNFDAEEDEHAAQADRPVQQPVRRSNEYRRSAEYNRYDADPQVIGDDFSKLDLKDGEHPPRTSSRPLANPNLFRSTSDRRKPSPASGRKVSFQEGPPEEIRDMYSASSPKPTPVQTTSTTASKPSKWQPLSTVQPSPVPENDPFSLGDSDDEKDAKPIILKDVEADATNADSKTPSKDTKDLTLENDKAEVKK